MTDRIPPRSPRETMAGWSHLPRYVDKIRLHLGGRLHADYVANLGKGFDALWLRHAGLEHERFVAVVRGTTTDGEVCDWVRAHVAATPDRQVIHLAEMLDSPRADDEAMQARLAQRKAESGLSHRDDLRCFVDYIDADEGRR